MTDLIAKAASPDAPTVVNEYGGAQSDLPVRFDLIDAKALFEIAKVHDHGARKYGANNWRHIHVDDHLNHLLTHVYAYLAGDETDEHLSHACCRAIFALAVALDDSQLKEVTVNSNSYVDWQESEGIHATKYVVGNLETDGHTHVLFLRDDLPVATSTEEYPEGSVPHQHSIEADSSERGFICRPGGPSHHIHTEITQVENERN